MHPNDLGHEYASRFIIHLLETRRKNAASMLPLLQSPLYVDSFEKTKLLEATDLVPLTSSGWSLDAHGDPLPCWVSASPGSSITFEVTGRVMLMFYRKNGAFGRAAVKVDDLPETTHEAWFDQTWGRVSRDDRHPQRIYRADRIGSRLACCLIATQPARATSSGFLAWGAAGVQI